MSAPAGWYADGNGQRYWDGATWTEQRAPGNPQRPWSGITIAALFMGVLSIIFWLIPPVAFIFATLAIGFGVTGLRATKKHHARGRGLALWGIVLASIAAGLWIIGWVGAALQ